MAETLDDIYFYLMDFEHHMNDNMRNYRDDIKHDYTNLSASLSGTSNRLYDQAVAQDTAIRSFINADFSTWANNIVSRISVPEMDLSTLPKAVWEYMEPYVNAIAKGIKDTVNAVETILTPLITFAKETIANLWDWIQVEWIVLTTNLDLWWLQISSWFNSTVDTIVTPLKAEMERLSASNAGQISTGITDLVDSITGIAGTIYDKLKELWDTYVSPKIEFINLAISGLPEFLWTSWENRGQAGHTALVEAAYNSKKYVTDPLKKISNTIVDEYMAQFPPHLIMDTLYHSEVDYSNTGDIALKVSTGAQAVSLIGMATGAAVDLAHPVKALQIQSVINQTVTNLGLKELISPYYVMPFEIGLFQPYRYELNRRYTPLIPQTQDLVRFVVREYFSDGVGTGSPAEFNKYMEYQGYAAKWSEAYWWSHWELPPLNQLYDAYHREIINSEQMDAYLKWHDYKPDPRKPGFPSDISILKDLSYELIPRVDLRRAFDYGAFDGAELKRRYKMLGYNEADAELQTKIAMEWIVTEEKNKARDELIRAYTEGMLADGDFRAKLTEYKIIGQPADYLIKYVQDRRKRERIDERMKAHSTAYRVDVETESEFTGYLSQLGYTSEAINYLLELENIKKRYTTPFNVEQTKAMVTTKDMISALESAYARGAITEGKLKTELGKLDLKADEVEDIIALAKVKATKKPEEEKPEVDPVSKLVEVIDYVTALSDAYRRDAISTEQFKSELTKLKISADMVTKIVKVEDIKKAKKPSIEKPAVDPISKLVEVIDYVTALSGAYRRNALFVEEFKAELTKLGISADMVTKIVDVEDLKKAKAA
jgi:hypothetical protein